MQEFPGKLFGKIMKTSSWVLLIIMVLVIKFASTQPLWVEENYSANIYPTISKIQRSIFGWIPFSVGDLIYAFLVLIVLIKTFVLIRTIYKKQFTRQYLLSGLKQIIFFFLLIYVLFYSFWGLNYSRLGIANQLGLEVKEYSKQDLDTLITTLQQRVNFYAHKTDTSKRDSTHSSQLLFKKGEEAYLIAAHQFPFLQFSPKSIKPSLYSSVGHILGFTGYYNPFSGEAQLNTAVPKFLRPFIVTHEIGHQLGYAKENEANFSGFLVSRSYNDVDFRYSMYWEMYFYSVREMFRFDIKQAICYRETLDTLVKKDYREWINYLTRKKNFIEPFVSSFYDGYLKANNQPLGKETYNQVVSWLVAYYKKYGVESL